MILGTLMSKIKIWDGTTTADVVTHADDDTNVDGKSGLPNASVLYARIDADTVKPLRMDASTHSIQTIEYDHHEIHSGSSFSCHYENLCTNTGEQTVIAFNTPDTTKWIHVTVQCGITSIARCSIVENPSIDVDEGTDLTIFNRNRNSATTSTVSTIETSPEAGKATSYNETQAAGANITETTQLDSVVLGSAGVGVNAGIGGTARGQLEWVLDQNNQYAFIIESLDNGDNYHTIELTWYEHTDKD